MQDKKVYINFFGQMMIKTAYGTLNEDDINSNQMKKLIAYLVLNRNSLISVDILTAILWPQGNEEPYTSLRGLVFRLRKIIKCIFPDEDFIVAKNGAYAINKNFNLVVDAEQLSVISKYNINSAAAKAYLDHACYPFMESISTDIWGLPVCTFYNTRLITYLYTAVNKMIEEKDYDDAIKYASKGLMIDHLSEELHLLIIDALVKKGCRKLALNHFENTVTMFQNEYSISPTKNFTTIKYKIITNEED